MRLAAKAALEEFLEQKQGMLVRFIEKKYPRLRDQAEDVVQQVLCEVLEHLHKESVIGQQLRMRLEERHQRLGDWGQVWSRYLFQLLSWRAVDVLRKWERKLVLSLADAPTGWEPVASSLSPSTVLGEAQEHQRRIELLSDLLRGFCRWCESRRAGGQMKEVYERRLRGQEPSAIAQELRLPVNTVHQYLSRARAWLQEQVAQRDPRHSVFGPVLGQGNQTNSPSKGASSFAEVLRLAVEEIGALCPSPERLQAHCQGKDQAPDIDYHLKHCRLCQVDRQALLS
jgi:DNA-directed RNA polymerase specialized sigma24 family protein